MSEKELLSMLKKGKSLIRYGDGEIYMINYGSVLSYQPYNRRLRNYLLRAIKEYSNDSPYIIGIPKKYISMPNKELKKINLLNCWLPLKVVYKNVFPKKDVYYFDAHQFYFDKSFERILEPVLKGKKVILVTGAHNIKTAKDAGMHKRLNVVFIETPSYDSFSKFDEILEKIIESVQDKDNTRVLLSVGPASKALVYELSKMGIISYDLGRGVESVYGKNSIENFI